MQEPIILKNEKERLKALEAIGLMYTPAEDRFDRITRMATKIFRVETALVSLVAENCQWFKSKTGLNANETSRSISFCGHAILADDIFMVPDTHLDERFSDNPLVTGPPYIRFYAGQPIATAGGLKLGTLCIIDPNPRTFTEEEKEQLRDFAGWVENEIMMPKMSQVQQELIQELSVARRQALLDPLTSLWNRTGITEIMQRESARALREAKPFALIMCDIDHFKNINDTYGHPGGDQVLRDVSKLLRGAIRTYDAVGRIGGEEFLVVLADCDLQSANSIGEKIRARVAAHEVDFEGKKIKMTLSSGIAIHGGNEKADIEGLVAKADKLMYLAKHQGRNRCISNGSF